MDAVTSKPALETLAEAIPHLVFFAAPDGGVEYVNARFETFTGKPPHELLGWNIAALVHADDRDAAVKRWSDGVRAGAPYDARYRLLSAGGTYRWVIARASPMLDSDGSVIRWFGTLTDVHEQVELDEQLRFLNAASDVLASSLESEVILQRITELGVEALGDWCTVHDRDDEGCIRQLAVWHKNPHRREDAEYVTAGFPPRPGGPVDKVMRSGEALLVPSVTLETMRPNVQNARHLQLLDNFHICSAMIVPLTARGKTMGAMSFAASESKRRFDERDLAFAQAFAQRAAVALQNAIAYEREHRVAMTLQRTLLPEFLPSVPGLIFSSTYRPASTESLVGGDWYDAFLLSDGSVAVSMGDVAGHGLEAAALMGKMRELFRATAVEETRPSEMLRRVNRALLLDGNPPMVTAIFGVFDCWQETFTAAIAGHPLPMIVRDGIVEELDFPANVPLGVNADYNFESRTAVLKRGDLLALYTDGLTENERDAAAGTAILGSALLHVANSRIHGNPAELIVSEVLEDHQFDDVALLIARFQGTPISTFMKIYQAVPASAAHVRTDMRAFLTSTTAGHEHLEDLVLATGEAVNNAIEHAFQGKDGEFIIRGQRYSDRLIFEIEDNGKWRINQTGDVTPAHDQERGRGLFLMRQLVDRAIIERTPLGTRVTLEQTL